MIQSQQALLSQHGIAVKNCTELLQQTQFSFESELEANAQSQARLRDLLQRKASSEKMVRNVSSKIMKLRRKRDKDATRNMKGKGEDKST
jgi:DNA-binding transcriptional MerR regulator